MPRTPTKEALQAYAAAGEIVRSLRQELPSLAREGARLIDVAERVEGEIVRRGGRRAFPCNISVNEIASHYTPAAGDPAAFRRGDLAKIDLGVLCGGYIADSAVTLEIGTNAQRGLIDATAEALAAAIAAVRPGATTGEIGRAIEAVARQRRYRVLKGLYGHDLGRDCLHGGLAIPNHDDGSRDKIKEGDVLAIEPFLTAGDGAIDRRPGGHIYQVLRRGHPCADERERKLLSRIERDHNGFPFAGRWVDDPEALDGLARRAIVAEYPLLAERDGAPVAQAEHTIIVGREGNEIIT